MYYTTLLKIFFVDILASDHLKRIKRLTKETELNSSYYVQQNMKMFNICRTNQFEIFKIIITYTIY